MEDFTLKFNQLDSQARRLILDFMDLLLKKQPENGSLSYVSDKPAEYFKQPKQLELVATAVPPKIFLTPEEFRKRLLENPIWSEDELQIFEENREYFASLNSNLHKPVLTHLKALRATQTAEEAKDDPFGNKAFKKRLLEISAWSEDDVQAMEDNIRSLKSSTLN